MTTLTETDLEQLAETWMALETRRQEIVEAQDGIKSQIRDALPDGAADYGNRTISIRPPTRRFSTTTARELLPAEILAEISTAIDTTKARQILPPALYDACRTESGVRVVTIL